jgi:tetratricopeptide (TPR) repeat protein
LNRLNQLHAALQKEKDWYKVKEIEIQIKTGEAWIQFASANKDSALYTMRLAANMEDSIDKHPVTPGEVLPARELLGDMLLQLKQTGEALTAYETVLKKSPNRFNSLYNAGVASEKLGDNPKTVFYFKQLLAVADNINSDRPELTEARSFLKMH